MLELTKTAMTCFSSITVMFIVFEASPRLGDKAWQRLWASRAPRPTLVWRPLNRIWRHLGVERRRTDAYSSAMDTGC
jgi:hypothetical protein